jgi:hypothetical protein
MGKNDKTRENIIKKMIFPKPLNFQGLKNIVGSILNTDKRRKDKKYLYYLDKISSNFYTNIERII